ncbi:MAG: hypothetical protein AAB574_03345 [Patescibacteria group bacterium]
MNQSRLLLGVLLLSLFSFGLFQIGNSVTKSSVLGDSTVCQQIGVYKPDTIPCEVVSPIAKSYCTDPQNWLLCKTLQNNLKTYCPTPAITVESYSAGPTCETDPPSFYSIQATCSDGFSQIIGDPENINCSSLNNLLSTAESLCTNR